MTARGPLAHPAFRVLWIAAMVSWTGSFVQDVAERWLMLDLTSSPLAVASLSSVLLGTSMVMLLPAGILADRVNRRSIVIVSQAIQAVVSGAVCVLAALGKVTPAVLFGAAAAAGLGMAVGSPAWTALVPRLVPRNLAADAIALNAVAFNVARAVGPAIGGGLLARTTPAAAFGINALSFCAVIAAMLPYPLRSSSGASSAASSSQQAISLPPRGQTALGEPLRLMTRPGFVRGPTLSMMAFTPGCAIVYALLPAFAKTSLEAGATSYGLMLGAMGLGAVLGASLLRKARERGTPPRRLVVTTMAIYAVGSLALSRAGSVGLALALLVPSGVGWLGSYSSLQALVQVWTPDAVRARVLSLYMMAHYALWSVFAALGGVIAERVSVRAAIGVGGALALAAAVTTSRAAFGPSFLGLEEPAG